MLKLKVEHTNTILDFKKKYHEVFHFYHFTVHSVDCLITYTNTCIYIYIYILYIYIIKKSNSCFKPDSLIICV